MQSDERLHAVERATDIPLLILALAMIPLLVVPAVADLSDGAERLVLGLDWAIWGLFAADFGVKLAVAPPDLDCDDLSFSFFTVLPPDPHGFDADFDGIGVSLSESCPDVRVLGVDAVRLHQWALKMRVNCRRCVANRCSLLPPQLTLHSHEASL